MLNIKISMPSLKTSDPSIDNFVNSNDNIYNNKKYWIKDSAVAVFESIVGEQNVWIEN